jgi:hypothetical protein
MRSVLVFYLAPITVSIHQGVFMRQVSTFLILGFSLVSPWAQAADPAPVDKTQQQNKMAMCSKEADGKKGEERKAFM